MLTYIHIGRWCVSEPPACWGLPASPSSSSAARSWPDRPSCHRQRALSCGQWSCSLGSSTQSAPFRPFSAAIDDHEMTAAGRPGSWAESPSPHTLSCSPSWCSLDYYLVSTRCARHASQTCVPGWPKPATIPVALPHTLRAASRLLAFAQDTGRLVATGRLCRRAASSCCPSSSRRRPWPSPRSPPPRALSLGGADPSEPRLRCRCRVVRCAVHRRSDIFANLCTVRVRRPAARVDMALSGLRPWSRRGVPRARCVGLNIIVSIRAAAHGAVRDAA